MRKIQKSLLFWMLTVITGVLILGAPVCALASEEGDYSQEGQISRPSGQASGAEETGSGADDATDNTYGYYTIMGDTTVTAEDMVSHFNRQNMEYPSQELEKGGAPDIETFCELLIKEAQIEGVRGEIVFEQAMLETGWLQFQGDCSAGQYNFAGLGATGNGEPGITFPDVSTGLRAQVQHLKAYASSQELEQECVDERFDLVMRESAPYVEWLGIRENPYGGGWAAGENYGYKLRSLLAELKGTEYVWPTPAPEVSPAGS
ncbi:MAG: glucosaminidase domain-containing protein [Eubacteriales bacterium]|nr:glucosaminidase domain-containing protein [Eubacteriales bacterium]